jgi:DNA-binding transcriptional LysR family regulator
MRLRHIEVFHAVFITGSVSNAARALNVSQPTVSKVLKHAEDQLGFSLFHRTKGRLVPTEKAQELFSEIEPIFNQVTELRKFTARLASEKKGRLRFAMTPAFSLQLGPQALAAFAQKHANIIVEVETLHATQVVKALLDKSIDIGLVFDAPAVPGITSSTIGQTEFICVAPASMNIPSDPDGLALEKIENLPLITLNQKSVLGRVLSGKLASAFSKPIDSHFIVETYHIAKRLVEQGAGIAIIDKITAFSGDESKLQFHKLEEAISINVCVVWRVNEPLNSYQSDFIDILSNTIKNFNT